MSITAAYSGVVLDQNATTTGSLAWRDDLGAQTLYQTFFLPSDYLMGSTLSEERYPPLSGFQVMVTVDPGYETAATLDYTMEYYVPGTGWTPLANGTTIGCHAAGQAWVDIIFPDPIPVTAAIAKADLRFSITARTAEAEALQAPVITLDDGSYRVGTTGLRVTLTENVPFPVVVDGLQGFLLLSDNTVTYSVQQGISAIWYVSPTPLIPKGATFLSDGVTPLVANVTTSLDFRILSLTADHGVDFLGNEYRSCVIQQDGINTATWTSPPLPSQFAVVSRYMDVRPQPAVPLPEYINYILNPGFEWDVDESSPFGWTAFNHLSSSTLLQVQQTWAAGGVQSLRSTSSFIGNVGAYAKAAFTQVAVTPNETVSASCSTNILSVPNGATVSLGLTWFDPTNTQVGISTSSSVSTDGLQDFAFTTVAPATAVTASLTVGCLSDSTGTFDLFIDDVQFTVTDAPVPYFDGDMVGAEWLGQRGQSPSAFLAPLEPEDDTVVIDGIALDPSTPNMAFNVYYSVDDAYTNDNMSETDWESKLWTRVPEVYVSTQAQQYVFPAPVTAKYMQVEFTNLQPQTYSPGPFAQPVAYKKFPTWVADFFIAQLTLPSFVSNSVSVTTDALNFAYSYYLDDVQQTPATPRPAPGNVIPTLTDYFSQSNAANQVDSTTLAQINLVLRSFQQPTGTIVNTNTLLGQSVLTIATSPTASSVAETPLATQPDLSVVSSSSREPVVFEQSLPVMYFFLTCRHAYKELTASFDYNRAYFAGVNNISFIRHDYTTPTDTAQYVESGNDTTNALLQDFDIDTDQAWYTY